jgi:hypothetical protein
MANERIATARANIRIARRIGTYTDHQDGLDNALRRAEADRRTAAQCVEGRVAPDQMSFVEVLR